MYPSICIALRIRSKLRKNGKYIDSLRKTMRLRIHRFTSFRSQKSPHCPGLPQINKSITNCINNLFNVRQSIILQFGNKSKFISNNFTKICLFFYFQIYRVLRSPGVSDGGPWLGVWGPDARSWVTRYLRTCKFKTGRPRIFFWLVSRPTIRLLYSLFKVRYVMGALIMTCSRPLPRAAYEVILLHPARIC